MDNFDLKAEPKVVKRKPVFIWNILTILILLGVVYLIYYFASIYINPNGAYNPFPPAPLPTLLQTPTPTSTIILQPPTWTPTLTSSPEPSRTKAPTWTAVSVLVTPDSTLTPTAGDTPTINTSAMPATATIAYQASTTMHADLACKWMGVGGVVMDAANKPLTAQVAQLGGNLNGKDVSTLIPSIFSISGSNTAYGASGFEFGKLSDQPVASTQTLWIQLFDNNGQPLSDKIYFDTYNDCAKNLVMVVFTKTR